MHTTQKVKKSRVFNHYYFFPENITQFRSIFFFFLTAELPSRLSSTSQTDQIIKLVNTVKGLTLVINPLKKRIISFR